MLIRLKALSAGATELRFQAIDPLGVNVVVQTTQIRRQMSTSCQQQTWTRCPH